MKIRKQHKLLAGLLLASLTAACGGGEDASRTEQASSPQKTPPAEGNAIQEPPPDPGARPPAPEQVFSSRFKPMGPWYDQLAARVSPRAASDPWPTESVANFIKRGLMEELASQQRGEGGYLMSLLSPDSRLIGTFRPAVVQTAARGGLEVVTGDLGSAELLGPEPVITAFRDLVAPHVGSTHPRFQVWMTSSWMEDAGRFQVRGAVRISSDRERSSLQTSLQLSLTAQVQGSNFRLTRLEGDGFTEVEASPRIYGEYTQAVIGPDAAWLGDDALRRTGRTDRLIIYTDVYLGMHGMAIGDVDGDGLEDVYVARQGGEPNLLLKHLPGGGVRDVAADARVDLLEDTGGVLIVDIDGDGGRDILAGIGGALVILWNDGEGVFEEHTVLSGESRDRIYSIAAADADGDGDLDIADTRYFTGEYGGGAPAPYHDAENGARNAYWRNEGGRSFVDATDEVGMDDGNDRFSLSALWEDVDDDGDPDLYVVNDFGRNNLYLNDGGKFRDAAAELGLGDMAAGMGISAADVDLDGRTDLYVSNMYTAPGSRVTANPRFMPMAPPEIKREYQRHTRGNTLLSKGENGRFQDVTDLGATAPGGWAWGAMFLDFENDGLQDLYVPNGFTTGRDPRDLQSFFWRVVVNASPLAPPVTEGYMQAWQAITRLSQRDGYSWNGNEFNYAYKNLGAKRFADVSAAVGLDYKDDGRVALVCDWDGDGRQDLWIRNRTAPLVRFVRNEHPDPGNALVVQLADEGPNTDAIGGRVDVVVDGIRHTRTVRAGEGFLGGSSTRLHFGLGSSDRVEEVVVRWPDGSESRHEDLPAVGRWVIRRGESPRLESAFEEASFEPTEPARVPPSQPDPDPRVVLLERLPFSALPLPSFDGASQPLSDHSGRPTLVYLWGSWDERAREGLRSLALGRDQLTSASLVLHPISLDGPRDEAYARGLARSVGLTRPGGRADRRTRALIEVLLQAALQPYDDLELPLGLLFDSQGRLVCLYLGEVDPEVVARDARLSEGAEGIAGRLTTGLTGGRWLAKGPARPLRPAAEFLRRERSEDALADELESFASERD